MKNLNSPGIYRLLNGLWVLAALSAVPGQGYGQTTPEKLAASTPILLNRQAVSRTNIPASSVDTTPTRVNVTDPFAAPGIAIGTLRLNTFLKQTIGFSNNRQNSATGDAGPFSTTEIDWQLRSGWQRHELAINGNAQYEDFFDDNIESGLTLEVDGSLRLDLVDGYAITLGGNYQFEKEAATSTSLTSTAVNQPGVHSFGTFAQIQRSARHIALTLRGSIDRSVYDDARLSGGGAFSQEDRNVTTFGATARLGYQNDLALSPFVQLALSKFVHDLAIDRNGEQRDSFSVDLRGGIEIDISEKISGEISVGFINQEFTDPGLATLAGFVMDADFTWSPQRDTQISFLLGSNLAGSTTSGDSGSISYNGGVEITRRIRDNLALTGALGVAYTNFEGLNRIDTTYTASFGAEYWFNRTLSLTADADFESLESNAAGSSYQASRLLFGIKLQR